MAYDLRNLDPNSTATPYAGSSAVPGGISGLAPGANVQVAPSPIQNYSSTPGALPNYGQPGATPGTFNTSNASSGDLAALTASINAMNVAGQNAAQAARIPGGTALSTAASQNTAQELAGQLPNDVINQIGQQAAERGINGSNTNADYLKALGLTSAQEQEQGQSDLTAGYARSPIAPLFDPTTMLETPYQAGQLGISQGQLSLSQQEAQQQNALAIQQQQLAEQAQAEKYQTEEQQLQQSAELQREQEQAQQALQTQALAAQYQRELLGQQGGYGSTSGTSTNPWAGAAVEPGETATLYGAGGTGYGGFSPSQPMASYTLPSYNNMFAASGSNSPDNAIDPFYTYSNTGD